VKFAVTDLFVVGLGFDLVGAWLLARGLIAKPQIIVSRNTSYWGSNAPSALAAAEDRIDGQFGVASLLLGFGCQAVGYVLDLAGVGTTPVHSTGRTVTALGLLLAAVVIALGVRHVSRTRLLLSLLVEIAHWQATSADKPAVRQDRADPAQLASWAGNLNLRRRAEEDQWAYTKRAFGLTDADLIERPDP
jgi:hypothetical protein